MFIIQTTLHIRRRPKGAYGFRTKLEAAEFMSWVNKQYGDETAIYKGQSGIHFFKPFLFEEAA